MRGAEFRRFERWSLSGVHLRGEESDELLQVLDVSAGGLGLAMQHDVTAGAHFRVSAPTADELLLEARHCRSVTEGGFTHRVGAAYVDGDQGMAFHQWLLERHLAAERRTFMHEVEGVDQRRSSRVCVGDGAVSARLDAGTGVVVYDVSDGGLAVLATQPRAVGREFNLKVADLPKVRVRVRHCEELPDSPAGAAFRYRLGTMYVEPGNYSSLSASILDRYIDQLIEGLDQAGVQGLPWNDDEEDDMGTRLDLSGKL